MINTEEKPDGIHINFDCDFTVANATQITEALTLSASRKGPEILSLINVSAIDVTGIQLAYGWKTTLEGQGRNANVILPEDEAIKDLLVKTGIAKMF